MKFNKQLSNGGLFLPSAALKISGFEDSGQVEIHALKNTAVIMKQQMTAIKDVASGLSAAMRGQEDAEEKAASAINSLDAAIYGDRTEWIRRADAALAAFNG